MGRVVTRILRGFGWTFIAAGVVLLLYVIYLLFYTNLTTSRAQGELREVWDSHIATSGIEDEADDEAEAEPIELGDAFAVIWFERPGSDEPIVHEGPLFVVHGVTLDLLRLGPGHYPHSASPGEEGNFSIAGHRTTHGAPFYNLDELEPGDAIHAIGRDGRQWRYTVRETMVVAPQDVWVVEEDPLGDGFPLLTLTTCHPRFSAAQRYVVFAGLDGEVTS